MHFVELLKVIVLGIVEGFTEWLPISSTGHMILVDELIHLEVSKQFKEMFLVVIQLGAMLAVVITFFSRLNPFVSNRARSRAIIHTWIKVGLASIPAVLLGVFLDDVIDEYFGSSFLVAVNLIVYGIFFILIEKRNRRREPSITKVSQIDYQMALNIGMIQVLALLPGTSRSGVTILGAMLLGCSRTTATEFSFFLGLPILFGASFLKIVKFFLEKAVMYPHEVFYLLVGMAVAFFVSAYSISFLMGWIKRHDFVAFGYYRIILGGIIMIWFAVSSLAAA